MPFFDRRCETCGSIQMDCLEPSDAPVVLCMECGEPTVRAWIAKTSNVIGDECDFVSRNGGKEPIRFRSKIEHRRWLKEHGYRINDTHVGELGSDKSRFTQRLSTMDPQTMQNAMELVARAAQQPATRSDDGGPRGITSNDGVIRYLRDQTKLSRGEFM